MGEDLQSAEAGYENALWLLQAILDSILHNGQEVGDADRIMIEKGKCRIGIGVSDVCLSA